MSHIKKLYERTIEQQCHRMKNTMKLTFINQQCYIMNVEHLRGKAKQTNKQETNKGAKMMDV